MGTPQDQAVTSIDAMAEKAKELRGTSVPESGEYFGNTDAVNARPAPTPIEDYIQAQHLFVEAQTEMIHHQDVPRFATAQESYIIAQTKFITSMLGKK